MRLKLSTLLAALTIAAPLASQAAIVNLEATMTNGWSMTASFDTASRDAGQTFGGGRRYGYALTSWNFDAGSLGTFVLADIETTGNLVWEWDPSASDLMDYSLKEFKATNSLGNSLYSHTPLDIGGPLQGSCFYANLTSSGGAPLQGPIATRMGCPTWVTNSATYGFYEFRVTQPGGTVPEPATLALAGLGLLGVAQSRRKRKTA